MSAVKFERRPVAGLAGSISLLNAVQPGQTLELAADLETVDEEAVAYGGTAETNGQPVIRLEHCVGPMAPGAEFDDAQALRDRFAVLSGPGATPGGFGGLPAISLDRTGGEPGETARATIQVPVSAPFFADHFPRRPVFPGTLLMDENLQLAAALANELSPPASGGRWVLTSVSDVKLRAFIPPGQTLELETKVKERREEKVILSVETRLGKKVVGGALVHLAAEGAP
jgi:3-hydroxymyristoyl/3-hydroxydecanoyl-(acyl carrier protein) dehydratase